MRLLHPRTLAIVAYSCKDGDFKNSLVSRKQIISHAWSEVFKSIKSGKPHPKMFLNEYELGVYLKYIKWTNDLFVKCNLNYSLIDTLSLDTKLGFYNELEISEDDTEMFKQKFDDNYLFSDATSLYFKGLNIFPYIFGDDWRKYVPIESHKEIKRIVDKYLTQD